MKKVVRRKRNEIQASPNAPQDLLTLEIPDSFKVYSPSAGMTEPFLLDDSGPGVNRILIFGRNRSLDILYNSKIWYCDGTFKIAPSIFSQVFVILAEALGGVHPLIYALLPNKQEKTYTHLFKMLNQLKPGLNPTSISCDFEQAILKSIKAEYPNAEIDGCLYHFSKNVYKKICDLGVVSNYRNNADFSILVKMVVALTFIPINDIDLAIELLSEYLPDELQPLLDWFEDNYVGRINRNGRGRRLPLFPPSIWTMYNRVLNGKNRTNNHAEAANRRLNMEMGVNHPTLWSFITCLQKVQAGRDFYYSQLEAGNSPPKKLKKYIDVDKRILKIVKNYEQSGILTFLRGIAQNISVQ